MRRDSDIIDMLPDEHIAEAVIAAKAFCVADNGGHPLSVLSYRRAEIQHK